MQQYQERIFRDAYPLSPKKPLKKTLLQIFSTLPLIIFFASFFAYRLHHTMSSYFFLELIAFIFSIGIPFTIGLFLYQLWYYRTYFYNVTDKFIIIRKGPLAPQEITIPFERIQDIYVDQDIWDRLFGIYDVHISTATAISGQRAHIDGVEKEVAEKIRGLLLNKIQGVTKK